MNLTRCHVVVALCLCLLSARPVAQSCSNPKPLQNIHLAPHTTYSYSFEGTG